MQKQLTPSYFDSITLKIIAKFLSIFYENVFKIKKINELGGSNQLQIDFT